MTSIDNPIIHKKIPIFKNMSFDNDELFNINVSALNVVKKTHEPETVKYKKNFEKEFLTFLNRLSSPMISMRINKNNPNLIAHMLIIIMVI